MKKRNATIPSLFTQDMNGTLKFYEQYLGFSKTSEWKTNDTLIWAEIKRQDTTLWFFANPLDQIPTPIFSGLIYIFIDDVDAFAKVLNEKLDIRWGPVTQDYGLRELGLKDNNGYFLVFAQDAA